MSRLQQFFSANFMAPHGYCFLWLPEIVWVHVVADLAIALAYFSIPIALWHFARKRPDIPFNIVFILFAAFITLCGLTHIIDIIVLWIPIYGIQGLVLLVTGLVSVAVAIFVWKIMPVAVTLPSPSELQEINIRLNESYEEIERRVQERTLALEQANEKLILEQQRAAIASQAKTDFLANMSHEIRTPMNVVIGLSRLLHKSQPLTDRQKECTETLKSSAESMMTLIDDLLDINRIERNSIKLEKSPFRLDELIHDTTRMMAVKAEEKGLLIHSTYDALKDLTFIGDQHRIRQVLINLFNNAIKFTDSGKITLAANLCSTEKPDTALVTIAISDTGIGIAADKIDVIFDKFVQADTSTSRKHGGAGLGLAITQSLLSIMGGQINVISTPDQGSTFTVELPLILEKTMN